MKQTVARMRSVVARSAIALGCLLAVMPVSETAQAQPTPEDVDRARRLFQRGLEYEQAENWGKALDLFREVGQVKLTPQVRYHIALCEENLGKLVAALGGYKLALRGADSVGAGFKEEVERRIADLMGTIPKLVIKRGKGAEGAVISLDGSELGARKIGVEMAVDPGPHTITATAHGYEDYMETVAIDEQKKKTVTIKMKKLPKDQVPATSGTAGQGDGGVWEEPDRTIPYIIGGSGIAFLLAGGAFIFLRMDAIGSAEEICGGSFDSCRPQSVAEAEEANGKLEDAQLYTTLAGVSAGVGAAAVGVALTMILTEPSKPAGASTARLQLVPQVSPQQTGLVLSGSF